MIKRDVFGNQRYEPPIEESDEVVGEGEDRCIACKGAGIAYSPFYDVHVPCPICKGSDKDVDNSTEE